MLALAMRREHMTGRSNYEPANPLAGFEHLQHNSGNPFAVVPSSEGRVRETRPEAEGELQEFVDIAQVQQLLQQQQQQHQQQHHHHHHHHQQQAAAASCIWGAVYPPPPPALGYHHHHHHHHHPPPPPAGNASPPRSLLFAPSRMEGSAMLGHAVLEEHSRVLGFIFIRDILT